MAQSKSKTTANEATETNNSATTSVSTLTKQTGPAPKAAAVQHGGSRDGSIPALVRSLAVGEWFAVDLKDGKTNTSKGANIMLAARKAGIGLTRFRSEDGKDIYQRVEKPAPAATTEPEGSTENAPTE
jgi:hypothetical protein